MIVKKQYDVVVMLCVADYNNDGKSDLLVGHHGAVQLFKNTGTSFVDVTKEEGLEGEKVVKSAAIADMDGDGDRDILALRFVDTNNNQVRDFVAYENMGEGANPRFVQDMMYYLGLYNMIVQCLLHLRTSTTMEPWIFTLVSQVFVTSPVVFPTEKELMDKPLKECG